MQTKSFKWPCSVTEVMDPNKVTVKGRKASISATKGRERMEEILRLIRCERDEDKARDEETMVDE